MSENKNKKVKNIGLFSEHESLFRCPLCSEQMKLVDLKSLICTNNHCFDLAKQGYVNLLTHPLQTKYGKQMFASRRIMHQKGFFEPLDNKISEIIINEIKSRGEPELILDAGCGEGSHLSRILEKINQSSGINFLGVGLDISKEGILMAAKEYTNNIWCVGDLAKSPFARRQFNFILNILTPANYTEFKRMLAHDGKVIKVIPERDYLRELRDIFYEQTDKQTYSNDDTLELFRSKFKSMDIERVRYNVTLDHTWIEPLVQMTPLSWGTTEEHLQKALETNLRAVTVDLAVLVGNN